MIQSLEKLNSWIKTKELWEKNIVSSLPSPTFAIGEKEFISFSTNNYLSLSAHPAVVNEACKALKEFGVGNCESRLLGGDLQIYSDLEQKIAKMKKKDDAILYATGGYTKTLNHCVLKYLV